MNKLQRRPLAFLVDKINKEKGIIERHKFVVTNPIAGSFNVTNGKFLCEITLNEVGVTLRCIDKEGNVKYFTTENRNIFA